MVKKYTLKDLRLDRYVIFLTPAMLEKQKQEEEDQERLQLEKQKRMAEEYRLKKERINRGACTYCGGTFKGILVKTCSSCGKRKNC